MHFETSFVAQNGAQYSDLRKERFYPGPDASMPNTSHSSETGCHGRKSPLPPPDRRHYTDLALYVQFSLGHIKIAKTQMFEEAHQTSYEDQRWFSQIFLLRLP